jgi:nucleotide-binding universal stress UspA family protein
MFVGFGRSRHYSPMRSIVVGTDGSSDAELAVERAAEIAKPAGATVHLVTVVGRETFHEPIASSARMGEVDMGGIAESVLARGARKLEDAGVPVETHTREGDPARGLIEVADELDADLIVVGARGKAGLERFLLGSVSHKLSHYSGRTVMVVRPAGDGQ